MRLNNPVIWILASLFGFFVLCCVLEWTLGPQTPEALAVQRLIQSYIMGYGAGSSGH